MTEHLLNIPLIGQNHQEIIEDFCQKEKIDFPSIETVVKKNNIIFYNANNGIFLSFLPKEITDEQYFALDLLTLSMSDIKYMEARIENRKEDFILKENIGDEFSRKVIQSYFEKEKPLSL